MNTSKAHVKSFRVEARLSDGTRIVYTNNRGAVTGFNSDLAHDVGRRVTGTGPIVVDSGHRTLKVEFGWIERKPKKTRRGR